MKKPVTFFVSIWDLGEEFGLERSTVYRLLKEHGLQDLHQVVVGPAETLIDKPAEPKGAGGEKGGSKRFPASQRSC